MGLKFSYTNVEKCDSCIGSTVDDNCVKKTKGKPAIFGTNAPSVSTDIYTVPPRHFATIDNQAKFYRIPGVCFGECVGIFGTQILIKSTWPNKGMFYAVDANHVEEMIFSCIVKDVSVPDEWEEPDISHHEAFISLPSTSIVTLQRGRTMQLEHLSGGQQRNICMMYARVLKAKQRKVSKSKF